MLHYQFLQQLYYLKKKFVKHGHSKINPVQIFIDRSDSKQKHCKLVNNSEIITYLKSKGFKILQLSKLNFKQQIKPLYAFDISTKQMQ